MPATIKIKNSSTASAVPTSSDLVQGELAVNVTDRRIFTENASGTVVELGTNPTILTMGAAGSASAPVITRTGDTNTGMFFPAADTIAFAEGGTETLRLDSSGNMGLGVTPSNWSGIGASVFEFGSSGSALVGNTSVTNLYQNTIYNTSAFRYARSAAASFYRQNAGAHEWHNAPSGTAGNAISFTQAMTLDASGNLGVGTTSPTQKITVSGSIRATGNSTNFNETGAQIDAYEGMRLCSYISTGSAIQFLTNASGGNTAERARIDSSGNLLLNTTSTLGTTWFNVYGATSSKNGIGIQNSSDTGTIYSLFIRNASNTTIGSINNNGSTTSFTTTSDYRLKENVQPMTGALAKVSALKPCTYTWKESGFNSQGFIAHELQAVVPDAVVGEKDAVDEEGNPVYQGIDTSFLVATLTAAIQELKAEFDAYKATHP